MVRKTGGTLGRVATRPEVPEGSFASRSVSSLVRHGFSPSGLLCGGLCHVPLELYLGGHSGLPEGLHGPHDGVISSEGCAGEIHCLFCDNGWCHRRPNEPRRAGPRSYKSWGPVPRVVKPVGFRPSGAQAAGAEGLTIVDSKTGVSRRVELRE